MKFTGHERDLGSAGGAEDDLDYMHARHCSPVTGRFLSFDIGPVKIEEPQRWNRYAYALNNPLRFIDPTGRTSEEPSLFDQLRQTFLDAFNKFFPPAPVKTDPSAQALVEEGEINQVQANRMSPGAITSLTQHGLNEAGAALGAGAVIAGLKTGDEFERGLRCAADLFLDIIQEEARGRSSDLLKEIQRFVFRDR